MSVSVDDLVVSVASAADAEGMVDVIHAAFGARPALDPPSTAIEETPESIRDAFARGGSAIYATMCGRPAGVILMSEAVPGVARWSRVSVHPDFQRHGVGSTMVAAAEDYAAELGFRRAELYAREELADLIAFWHHRGFGLARTVPHGVILTKILPLAIEVPTAEDMQRLGARLATVLQQGDVIVASGELGAGKTTLAQGLGHALDSAGPIISPTFVLSRVHRSHTGKPDLVHVDAYRLTSAAELDDLDLDAHTADAITLIEWGRGLAERLAQDRLEIDIRPAPNGDHDARMVLIRGVGRRWHHVDLEGLQA